MRGAIQLLEREILALKEKEAKLLREIPARLTVLEKARSEQASISSQIDGLERALRKLRTPNPPSEIEDDIPF